MKEFTYEDLEKMSDKEVLLLCIAHWKNILKEETRVGFSEQRQKKKEFIYKEKLVFPNMFSAGCVLCERVKNCTKCIMYKYWSGKLDEEVITCIRDDSVFIDWLYNKTGATKSVIKALQHRLNVLRKEEMLRAKRSLPKSIYLIKRPDKNLYGLEVKVVYEKQVKRKFFNFKKYKSFEDCLESAVFYRNELEEQVNKPRTENCIKSIQNSNTKTLGISYYKRSNNYIVNWTSAEGIQRAKVFSIKEHGKEKAFSLAKKYREQKQKEKIEKTKFQRGY